jgi:Zn-dependent peptidase ImmA (M78 family)
MSFRRGFKAEAERIAAQTREELNLSLDDRLDPLSLARHLCIPVLEIGELAAMLGKPALGSYFLIEDVDSLSALTLFYGRKRMIVHNESHAPTRRVSNLAHEISHCILEHVPEPVLRPDGRRCWNEKVEAEAAWLAGALLLPRAGALKLARGGLDDDLIARCFGVSAALCRWRMNETGISSQLQRHANLRRTGGRAAAR